MSREPSALIPRRVPKWIGRALSRLPWKLRHFGDGWVWYYANGRLSALNRWRFDGWYWIDGPPIGTPKGGSA